MDNATIASGNASVSASYYVDENVPLIVIYHILRSYKMFIQYYFGAKHLL